MPHWLVLIYYKIISIIHWMWFIFPQSSLPLAAPNCFPEKISDDVKWQILRYQGEFCLPAIIVENYELLVSLPGRKEGMGYHNPECKQKSAIFSRCIAGLHMTEGNVSHWYTSMYRYVATCTSWNIVKRTWSTQRRRRQLPLLLCLHRAASLGQAQPFSEDEEPKPVCLAIDSKIESVCGREYQRCLFLLEEVAKSADVHV